MILTSIKTSRIPNRVYLHFSDGSYLPFFIDDVVVHSLRSGTDIDDTKLKRITLAAISYLLKDYALRQIAISPKTTRILSSKMNLYLQRISKKYAISVPEQDKRESAEKVLQYLQERGLLNDIEFVNFFVNKNRRKSSQEIFFLLRKNGVDPNLISSDLLDKEEDRGKIKKLILKRVRNTNDLFDFKSRNKIIAYLIRKGFSYDDVKIIIDDLVNSR